MNAGDGRENDSTQVRRTLTIFGHEEPDVGRIVIAGGGNVGMTVAMEMESRNLASRLRLVEADGARALHVADKLKRTIVLQGSALDPTILREAEIGEADLMVSLTNDDQINVLSSAMAKRLGAKSNLALINSPTFQDLAKHLGIDAVLNPRSVTISRILQHVRRGRIRAVHSVQNGMAEAIEAEALETSPLVGQPLRDLEIPDGMRIGAVTRNGVFIRPTGQTRIRPKDRVVLFVRSDTVRQVEQFFRVSLEFF